MRRFIAIVALGYLFQGALSWSQVECRTASRRAFMTNAVGASFALVASPALAQDESPQALAPVEVAVSGDAKKVSQWMFQPRGCWFWVWFHGRRHLTQTLLFFHIVIQ
jgi:hypothetical protein